MKTLLTIVLVSLLGISVTADPGSKTDYIITKDGKVVFAKVKFGLFRAHAKQANGNILNVNYKDIASYQRNGEIYEKKPLYEGRENTGKLVFMRKVSWRNGLTLYNYQEPVSCNNCVPRYFVFKDGETFWLEVDQRNSETIRRFFNREDPQ